MPRLTVVIPCFNEARRLQHAELLRLAASPDVTLLLVDDGSTDATLAELQALAARSGDIEVLPLPRNVGKAEAVRAGLQHALDQGSDCVGYLDADLATPVDEALRLADALYTRDLDAVLGLRLVRMGAHIERGVLRHYAGRVFATLASSVILHEPFYDTQCGAKLFRDTPALRAAIAEPFRSRWAFDVELLGRLLHGPAPLDRERVLELPLERWVDVAGSTMHAGDLVRTAADLWLIWRDARRRRS